MKNKYNINNDQRGCNYNSSKQNKQRQEGNRSLESCTQKCKDFAFRNDYNQNVPINSETAENVCLLKETKQGCTDASKEQWFLLLLTDI